MSKINYKKLDYKKIPASIIENALYGDGGLLDRVSAVIMSTPDDVHSVRRCAEKIGVSTQLLNLFIANVQRAEYKPKAVTLFNYAEKLGVE